MQKLEAVTRFLASRQLSLLLFAILCLSLIPGTLAESNFRLAALPRAVLICLAVNLLLCTARRIKSLPGPVLAMHLGAVVVMAGAVFSSLGFIATVNLYEGTDVDSVWRWDIEQEAPLGFAIAVRSIEIEYYPVPVKVGVLRGSEKIGLYTVKTGEQFGLEQYSVKADYLELPSKNLKLSIFAGNRLVGSADTEGVARAAPDFPYDFRLVAYQDPAPRRIKVNLTLSSGQGIIAQGTTEVNSPFEWNGLVFHNTQLERDRYGALYAGIQIVRDPGKPIVFAGFLVVAAGVAWWMYKKFVSAYKRQLKPRATTDEGR